MKGRREGEREAHLEIVKNDNRQIDNEHGISLFQVDLLLSEQVVGDAH